MRIGRWLVERLSPTVAVHIHAVVIMVEARIAHAALVGSGLVREATICGTVAGRLKLRGYESAEKPTVQSGSMEGVGGNVVQYICDVFHELECLLLVV